MILFEDKYIKIVSRQIQSDNSSKKIMLSFTGIGHALGGLNVQESEFFGAGRSFDNIICITDKTRSWGNKLDFGIINKVIAPLVGGRAVYSIGNSMGGFNAIVASKFMEIHTSISFVPQFSVCRTAVPWEDRWLEFTSRIEEFHIRTARDGMNCRTNYKIFSSGVGNDAKHASLFPVAENVEHYLFAEATHSLAQTLKEDGHLMPLLNVCFGDSAPLPDGLGYELISPANTGAT